MTYRPLVSILMPAYNAESTIQESIVSILEQKYDNFELIIGDDCSNDLTFEIIKSFNDNRIKIIKGSHLGLGNILNKLLYSANGQYCARMDSDDLMECDRINRQVDYMLNNPDCVLCGTQIQYYNGTHTLNRTPFPLDHYKIKSDLLKVRFSLCHPSIMFSAKVAKEIGGYNFPMVGEDLLFMLQMSDKGKLANLDYVGLKYRYSDKSVTATKKKLLNLNYMYSLYLYKNYNKDKITYEDFKKLYSKRNFLSIAGEIAYNNGNKLFSIYVRNYGLNNFIAYLALFFSVLLKPGAALLHAYRLISNTLINK